MLFAVFLFCIASLCLADLCQPCLDLEKYCWDECHQASPEGDVFPFIETCFCVNDKIVSCKAPEYCQACARKNGLAAPGETGLAADVASLGIPIELQAGQYCESHSCPRLQSQWDSLNPTSLDWLRVCGSNCPYMGNDGVLLDCINNPQYHLCAIQGATSTACRRWRAKYCKAPCGQGLPWPHKAGGPAPFDCLQCSTEEQSNTRLLELFQNVVTLNCEADFGETECNNNGGTLKADPSTITCTADPCVFDECCDVSMKT